MNKTVSLVIPDMHALISQFGDAQWPYLKLILARSSYKALKQGVFEYVLHLLGVEQQNSIAAIKLKHAGFSVEDRWVCVADLVNMQPNRDHVSVVESHFKDLTNDEARLIERDLNQYFEEEGFKFYCLSDHDWVCILPNEMNLPTISASNIAGQNIINYIPDWRTNASFRKLFSDAQMVLHHSQSNQLRSQQGKMEINSIWLHNAGQLPVNLNTSVNTVVSNDHILEAIAELSNVNYLKQLHSWDELLEINDRNYLVYVTQEDSQDMIKPELFEFLFEQLKLKKIDKLDLILDKTTVYSVSSQDIKKFWKRRYDLKRFSVA